MFFIVRDWLMDQSRKGTQVKPGPVILFSYKRFSVCFRQWEAEFVAADSARFQLKSCGLLQIFKRDPQIFRVVRNAVYRCCSSVEDDRSLDFGRVWSCCANKWCR